jgi:hypothetical protein
VRSQEEGWQEPYESRGSRTDLRGTGGEIPPVYPTPYFGNFADIIVISKVLTDVVFLKIISINR